MLETAAMALSGTRTSTCGACRTVAHLACAGGPAWVAGRCRRVSKQAAGWSRRGHRSRRRGRPGACAALPVTEGLVWVELPVDLPKCLPDLALVFPCAGRMQRAMADLSGLQAQGSHDPASLAGPRPVGGAGGHRCSTAPNPLRQLAGTLPADYGPSCALEGDGVHEIAVGPVARRIIEPGHFRFRSSARRCCAWSSTWATCTRHRGALHRTAAAGRPPGWPACLGRLDGGPCLDLLHGTRIGLECVVPQRALWLRALCWNANASQPPGRPGRLGNDARLPRLAAVLAAARGLAALRQRFGHRFMMDAVARAASRRPANGQARRAAPPVRRRRTRVRCLRQVYDEHAGLQAPFHATGRVTARSGLAARAHRAGRTRQRPASDLRCDHDWAALRAEGAHRDAGRRRRGGSVACASPRCSIPAPDPRALRRPCRRRNAS